MSNSTKNMRTAIGIIAFPKKVPEGILYIGNIVGKMTNNPNFPSPVPTLAAMIAAENDLHSAETAALSRTKGTASVRNAKLKLASGLTRQLLSCVQAAVRAPSDRVRS